MLLLSPTGLALEQRPLKRKRRMRGYIMLSDEPSLNVSWNVRPLYSEKFLPGVTIGEIYPH